MAWKRAVTKRINYSGPTARLKIVKGVYYRVGSISPQKEFLKMNGWKLIQGKSIWQIKINIYGI